MRSTFLPRAACRMISPTHRPSPTSLPGLCREYRVDDELYREAEALFGTNGLRDIAVLAAWRPTAQWA